MAARPAAPSSRSAAVRSTAANDRSPDRAASRLQGALRPAAPAGRGARSAHGRPPCVRPPGVQCRDSRFSSARVRVRPTRIRPPLRPGERRPMHPTRQSPTGSRPLGVGPGAVPSGGPTPRPGSRPGAPSRRPGQRYVPRGVKEGPMKGFVPPPRLSLSNEPLPITRSDHHHRRHQRKGSGGKAWDSRQGPDRTPAGARRIRHHQSDARRGTGQRHGASLRRGHQRHHLRRAGSPRTVSRSRLPAKKVLRRKV